MKETESELEKKRGYKTQLWTCSILTTNVYAIMLPNNGQRIVAPSCEPLESLHYPIYSHFQLSPHISSQTGSQLTGAAYSCIIFH